MRANYLEEILPVRRLGLVTKLILIEKVLGPFLRACGKAV